MIFFSGCKINIGLYVIRKRADGYHDLETVMFPVRGLCDAIEMIPGDKQGCRIQLLGSRSGWACGEESLRAGL